MNKIENELGFLQAISGKHLFFSEVLREFLN